MKNPTLTGLAIAGAVALAAILVLVSQCPGKNKEVADK